MLASLSIMPRALSMSPMATGKWASISVETNGLYVLTTDDLRSLGFTNPERVRIWGYGGGLLPEPIVLTAGRGLQEVPTLYEGGGVYFYGMGVTQWTYNPREQYYHHTTNHYTTSGYYLLSEGDTPLRMSETNAQRPTAPSSDANTYIATLLHEQDLYSLASSGRRLYGENLQTTKRYTYTHRVEGARRVRASIAGMAYPRNSDASMRLSIGTTDHTGISVSLSAMNNLVGSSNYHIYGLHREATASGYLPLSSNDIEVAVSINQTGIVAHLDYYELNVETDLAYRGGQLLFSRPPTANATTTDYILSGAPSDLRLLRVDASTSTNLISTTSLRDGEQLIMSLPAIDAKGQPSRYLALRLSDALRPHLGVAVSNQDLLGQTSPPDLLVITTETLKNEAERMARHYESKGLKTLVATQAQIFREFNGGTPDATAYRLAVRHFVDLYKRIHPSRDVAMQLLLIGDGAHDNRKLTHDWRTSSVSSSELLLTYQSLNSLDLSSYTTDDYFGIVSDERPKQGSGISAVYPQLHELTMDIGVGRLPVRTPEEARAVIDKIIGYEAGTDQGAWKTKGVFVADNGDGNSHTRQSLEIARELENAQPTLRLSKVLMSSYPRQSVGGQVTVPGAKRAFTEALERGVLLVNYNGHGSPKSWADEQILTQTDVQRFTHKHLPLWITATCDFGNFDALPTSAGEDILLHPTSGGVALLTTTRVVYDLPNVLLNKAVLRELFRLDSEGKPRPLGLVIRDAKNSLRQMASPENRLNFILLGSPLTAIQIPSHHAEVVSIANSPLEPGRNIEVQALEAVRIEGFVRKADGAIDGDFNGDIEVTIYDSEQELETIDNFNRTGTNVPAVRYYDYINVIHSGRTRVEGGRYQLEFVVPKDVAYSGRNTLISLYAYDVSRGLEVVGVDRHMAIRSGSNSATLDVTPPTIKELKLAGQDASSEPRIASSAELYAIIYDDTAINLSGAGIGHRIMLTIEGTQPTTLDLTPYYTPAPNENGIGIVRLALTNLPSGRHTGTLTIWDVHNNVTRYPFSFVVQEGLAPKIERLILTPSAVGSGEVSLKVWHNQAGRELSAQIWIYDMSGRLVAQHSTNRLISSSDAPLSIQLTETLAPLINGSYVLRLGLKGDTGAEGYANLLWSVTH